MAVHDVNPTELIVKVAAELKKDATIKAPAWAPFAKTGMNRERAPVQADWWHTRAAAILRKIFILGPIGTQKLRRKFGGRKNEGMAPEHFYVGAGNNIRKILQQLEKAGLAKQVQKDVHKGRIVTPKGHQLLERMATDLLKEKGIVVPVVSKAAKTTKAHSSEEKTETPAEKIIKAPKKPRAPRKKKEEAKPTEPKPTETPAPAAQ